MLRRIKKCVLVMFLFCFTPVCIAGQSLTVTNSNILEIKAIAVRDKLFSISSQKKIYLRPSPEDVFFYFGFTTNANRAPIRLCCKLEGHEKDWNMGGGGEMFLAVRLYNEAGDIVAHTQFNVNGESPDWRHDLEHSLLSHRRETIVVPPRASRLLVVLSSAGPPSTEGVYVMTDLNVSRISTNNESRVLLQFPDNQFQKESANPAMDVWQRDGTTPTMAKIVEVGQAPTSKALGIFDDDPNGHAEWHNNLKLAPHVIPGDRLVVEWNEMFSIGDSAMHYAPYSNLSSGNYLFRVVEVNLMGSPTGVEASLAVVVLQPFFKTFWFLGLIAIFIITIVVMIWRYVSRAKTKRKMLLLEQQRLLEQERLRIARDIHDDLGARVTQISLVSAMAYANSNDVNKMRGELDQISKMSRDLVTALYETVWTVNPENDNLKELGNYLFQIVNDLCEQNQCGCRFHIENLPREIIVPSHVRHNLCMVVKEAMNNIIKHANATEVKLNISFLNFVLIISIQDDGCGFDLSNRSTGHGLTNMNRRLEEIGGSWRVESRPHHGTTIWVYLKIGPRNHPVD